MDHISIVREQTLRFRDTISKAFAAIPESRADVTPPGWSNNARWHAGHLVVTPRLLTFGLLKEPLGVPREYRHWFGKGSNPQKWNGESVPSYAELVAGLTRCTADLFEALEGRENETFPQPYETSAGVILRTPLEAMNFSLAHDGIHLGLLFALRRTLAEA